MKLEGYLLERYSDMGSAYTCRRLQEEAARLGIGLDLVGVADLALAEEGTLLFKGQALGPRPFLINRYKWGHLIEAANRQAGRTYNRFDRFSRYVDKLAQMEDVRSSAFQMPAWRLGSAASDFEELGCALGVPFVAKGLESSEGREIWLIRNAQDLEALLAEVGPDKEILFEQCIQESLGTDIRVFAVRGEAAAAMRRTAHGDFRANFALGAGLSPYPIDSEICQAAEDVYRATSLDFFGLDLLGSAGALWFCELNVMAGMKGIEQVSGVNVASLVMGAIREDFQ